jgi:hypothetical protein
MEWFIRKILSRLTARAEKCALSIYLLAFSTIRECSNFMTKDERNSNWQQGVFLRRTVKRLFLSCLSRYFGARLAGACFTGTGLAEAGLPEARELQQLRARPRTECGPGFGLLVSSSLLPGAEESLGQALGKHVPQIKEEERHDKPEEVGRCEGDDQSEEDLVLEEIGDGEGREMDFMLYRLHVIKTEANMR